MRRPRQLMHRYGDPALRPVLTVDDRSVMGLIYQNSGLRYAELHQAAHDFFKIDSLRLKRSVEKLVAARYCVIRDYRMRLTSRGVEVIAKQRGQHGLRDADLVEYGTVIDTYQTKRNAVKRVAQINRDGWYWDAFAHKKEML